MKAIKNFNAFKKSLLSATNGNMVESFDSSNQFDGCEYQSYRVYVDDVHYYNMFVIYNFATNTYDVSLETSICAVSTMSRVCKTQKSLIESVVAWISYNYLNTKKIDSDSEETVKDVMEVKQDLNTRFGKKEQQYFDTDCLELNNTIIENINYCPNQNTCCIVSPFVHCDYNYKSDNCIKAHKNFIHDCEQVHKQMKAINNPNWHHVSLNTLANLDFDMLDEKRQLYLKLYRELKELIQDLHKCKSVSAYDRRLDKMYIRNNELVKENKISNDYINYVTRKISMCNVECGLWTSRVEDATGLHKSRRYNRHILKY